MIVLNYLKNVINGDELIIINIFGKYEIAHDNHFKKNLLLTWVRGG